MTRDSARMRQRFKTRSGSRRILYGLLAGLFGALQAFLLWQIGFMDGIERALWSPRVTTMAKPSASTKRIKLIAIDTSSLDWIQKTTGHSWPWPREMYAPLLSFLKRAGATSVNFDLVFEQPSNRHGDDELFAEAILNGPPFIAAAAFSPNETGATVWPESAAAFRRPPCLLPDTPPTHPLRVNSARFPIPAVLQAASGLANVIQIPDSDGIVRRFRLFWDFRGDTTVLSFALATAACDAPVILDPPASRIRIRCGTRTIRPNRNGEVILRYRGSSGTHETVSAAAVIQSEVLLQEGETPTLSPDTFRNCHVFVGITATAGNDLVSVPGDDTYPGVEVNMTALDNFLEGDFILDAPPILVTLVVMLLCLLAGIMGILAPRAWQNAVGFSVFLPLPFLLGLGAYHLGWWWPVAMQTHALLVTLIGAVVANYSTEGKQRRFIKQAFNHYLSPDVIERIMNDPGKLTLGGERRCLTIFFSDLQGFTSISEKMEPQQLTELLNAYLSDMTEIILDEGGTLDKYEGDAIIAFWNAPLDQDDHALRGVRTLIRCQRKLAERRSEFEQRYGVTLLMRIGMHTGDVVVGNMGSRRRFDYTMLGDAANLAARLEGANKAFDTYSMISSSTWERVQKEVRARKIGDIRVVGRKVPVPVYEPYGFTDEQDNDAYAEVSEAIRMAESSEYRNAFSILERHPDDPLAQTYAARCRACIDGDAWDGVWNLTSK